MLGGWQCVCAREREGEGRSPYCRIECFTWMWESTTSLVRRKISRVRWKAFPNRDFFRSCVLVGGVGWTMNGLGDFGWFGWEMG